MGTIRLILLLLVTVVLLQQQEGDAKRHGKKKGNQPANQQHGKKQANQPANQHGKKHANQHEHKAGAADAALSKEFVKDPTKQNEQIKHYIPIVLKGEKHPVHQNIFKAFKKEFLVHLRTALKKPLHWSGQALMVVVDKRIENLLQEPKSQGLREQIEQFYIMNSVLKTILLKEMGNPGTKHRDAVIKQVKAKVHANKQFDGIDEEQVEHAIGTLFDQHHASGAHTPPGTPGSPHDHGKPPANSGSPHGHGKPPGTPSSPHGHGTPPGTPGSHHGHGKPPANSGSHYDHGTPPGSPHGHGKPPANSGSHHGDVVHLPKTPTSPGKAMKMASIHENDQHLHNGGQKLANTTAGNDSTSATHPKTTIKHRRNYSSVTLDFGEMHKDPMEFMEDPIPEQKLKEPSQQADSEPESQELGAGNYGQKIPEEPIMDPYEEVDGITRGNGGVPEFDGGMEGGKQSEIEDDADPADDADLNSKRRLPEEAEVAAASIEGAADNEVGDVDKKVVKRAKADEDKADEDDDGVVKIPAAGGEVGVDIGKNFGGLGDDEEEEEGNGLDDGREDVTGMRKSSSPKKEGASQGDAAAETGATF